MEDDKVLDVTNQGLRELTMIPAHIERLLASGNRFKDFTKFAPSSTLRELDVAACEISSMKGIVRFPSLEWLCVDDNLLTTLNGIAPLGLLTTLQARNNPLDDTTAIDALDGLETVEL